MPSYAGFNHTVSLNSTGCLDNGRIMHEMLHTLGEICSLLRTLSLLKQHIYS